MTTDYIYIPVYITVDCKLVSCCFNDLPESISHLVNTLCSECSLVVMFQIEEYRELDLPTVQSRDYLAGFALDLHDCHSIGIFVHSNRDLVFIAFGQVCFKIFIHYVSCFCDSENSEAHTIISYLFPVNLALPCRDINTFYFHLSSLLLYSKQGTITRPLNPLYYPYSLFLLPVTSHAPRSEEEMPGLLLPCL